jgi:hypothetical protein
MLPPQTPGLTAPPRHLPPTWKCSQCQHIDSFPATPLDSYFTNTPLQCPKCNTMCSAWDIVLGQIRDQFMWELFSPLGATTTLYQSKLFLDSETHLNLHEYGLPHNAIVLDVNYSPTGMFCREAAGNNRRQRLKSGRLQFSGFRTYTHPDGPTECQVNIAVTWVYSSESDFAWNNLVSAFEAYVDGDLLDAIVPANVAVENRLFGVMSRELGPSCANQRLKEFLGKAATYSHQLNVILPYIARVRSFPEMDDRLRGGLNRLRDLRNDVAHRGYTENQLTKTDCAEVLTAAVFGFRYLDRYAHSLPPESSPN